MRKIGAVVKNMELQRRDYKKHNQPISINYTQTNSDAGYQLTDEQKLCVEASCRGANLKIKAFAGSGKTSTLVEIAKNLSGRGLYLAYNKVIQLDAVKKFPKHIDCKTAHSIAYGANAYRIKGRVRNLNVFDVIEYIEIERIYNYEENDTEELNLIYVAVTRAKRSLLLAKGVNVFIERLMSHNKKQRQGTEYGILPPRNIDVLAYEQCARA